MENDKYRKEINEIFNEMMKMGKAAEKAIEDSVKSLLVRDRDLAQSVISNDKIIDDLCKKIENDCLRVLLLDKPFANDFLEVSAALKMITDLERIGDYAVDIAEEVVSFPLDVPFIKKLEHIPLMANIVVSMVEDSINFYINKDVKGARMLDKRDDKVDELFLLIKNELIQKIKEKGDNSDQAIIFMIIAKYLERIGDHAVNIGEWVDYSITGSHLIS